MNDYLEKYRKILIAVVIAACMAVAAMTVYLFVPEAGYSREEVPIYFSGKVDGDGTAHFIDNSGKETEITGMVQQAERTADGRYMVTLYEMGNLVLMDGSGTYIQEIDSDVTEVYTIRDAGFVYEKESADGMTACFRYRYADESVLRLGSGDFMPADYTLDLLVYDGGSISIVLEDGDELEEIAFYDEAMEIELIDIAERGKLALWAEIDEQMHYIYLQEGEDTVFVDAVELEEEYADYSYYSAAFGEKNDQVILLNTAFHTIYTKKAGQAVQQLGLGNYFYSSMIYSDNDLFYYDTKADTDSFYFEAGDEDEYHIYHAGEGQAEQIVADADNLFDIKNKTILYAVGGDELYRGRLKNGSVIREKRIASDVVYAELSDDGKAMYYVKEAGTDMWMGSLYYLQEGEEAVKVSDTAEAFSVILSGDGGSMLYYEDVKYAEDELTTYGDLYIWTTGGTKRLIAQDVFRVQGIASTSVNPGGFGYFVYKEEKEDYIVCDYYYYNGKSSRLVAEDLLR